MTCGYSLGQGKQSFKVIMDDYDKRIQVIDAETSKGWHAILDFYGNLPDWATAVSQAGKFHYDASGKIHPHQRRISGLARKQFALDLQNYQAAIHNSVNFGELYENIEKFCKKSGIAELTVYDTAMRLGAFLEKHKGGCFKQQEVFLHNGAMEGAKKLFRQGKITKKPGSRMPLSAFAECFPNKDAWEVEEILCIYKDNF